MSKKNAPIPSRKAPKQARSQATVSAVLDAMIRILDREGLEAATTTRVAQVAGISVGTLYQYFSHRDAILDALQDRELDRAVLFMQAALSSSKLALSPELVARSVVVGLLSLYAAAPGLHRVLVLEGLRVTPAARVHAFDLRVLALIQNFLDGLGPALRRKNVPASAFVIFHAVRAAMLARMFEAPVCLDDATLVDEVTALVVSYLVQPDPVRLGVTQDRSVARERARVKRADDAGH